MIIIYKSISKEITIEILNKIKEYFIYHTDKNSFDILLSDELDSVNYMDSSYKIIDIFKHDYIDYHFKFSDQNKFFDIFIYQNEDINIERKYQMILCDNFVQIFRFSDKNYNNRVLVTDFKLPVKIYSFFDKSLIIIEKEINTDGLNYETI